MAPLVFPQQHLVMQLAKRFPDAVFYKPTTERVVALTLDDVPTPNDPNDRATRCILEAIAQHNQALEADQLPVQATFFVISSHLNPGTTLLQDMVQQGHEIANHGIADDTTALQHPEVFSLQLRTAHDRIQALCPQPLRWYRPGRGLYNQAMVSALEQMPGYEPRFALASMLPIDTFKPTNNPDFTLRYVSQFIFPGAILLLHGGPGVDCTTTAVVITNLLKLLSLKQYRVVTLSQLWDQP